MPPMDNCILNLPGFQIIKVEGLNPLIFHVCYEEAAFCPFCGHRRVRKKDLFFRKVRHESQGSRICFLVIRAHKFYCPACRRYFHQRFPALLPYQRATEMFQREVCLKHQNGIPQKTLSEDMEMGHATIERWYHRFLYRKLKERENEPCPSVLGIDEHFFTRKKGFATTFCDLRHHKVYDVALGRSEVSLSPYLYKLKDKERVRVVVMDLSETYRSIAKRHFPNAKIVADRFHVIRLINHVFLKTWQQIDPNGRKNRGLLSLFRRHSWNLSDRQRQSLFNYLQLRPILQEMYSFKQKLVKLMLVKHQTKRECKGRISYFLILINKLLETSQEHLQQLGKTLQSWSKEIVRMWRFTKTNSITEGFHNKMELIQRRAYGFRNFNNYRLRVRALCA